MLSGSFFFSAFASLIWVFYVLSNHTNAGIDNFVITTAIIVLPIFILWAIFGYVYQYISASVLNKNMYSLFKQMKKNQDYSDLIAKVLLEASQELKDNIVLNKFDVFIADMNELLSDIILRSHLASAEQIDNLWVKVNNGGKWAFGKVIIELNLNQPNLPSRLLQKSLHDAVLGGTILEFCSRYQSLVSSLEKHDRDRIFLNIIETGVLGKVFSLLATPADSIRQNRDLTLTHKQMSDVIAKDDADFTPLNELPAIAPEVEEENNGISETARRLFVNTFNRRKKEDIKPEPEEDPLSLAFAKSFGKENNVENNIEEVHNEEIPKLNIDENSQISEPEEKSMPDIVIRHDVEDNESNDINISSAITPQIENGFLSSQETLATIKKEWNDATQRDLTAHNFSETEDCMPAPKVGNDDYSYPFGGWTNADNYHK